MWASSCKARFDPRRFRLDVRKAPMMRLMAAHDRGAWSLGGMWLLHHLVGDHTTLEVMPGGDAGASAGEAGRAAAAAAVSQLRGAGAAGGGAEEHEAFFREMLGDVTEPTAPFGLTDVQGDGSGIGEARGARWLQLVAAAARRRRGRWG